MDSIRMKRNGFFIKDRQEEKMADNLGLMPVPLPFSSCFNVNDRIMGR